jgi:hypothetical protein
MPIWRNTTGDGLWGTAGNWLTDGSGSGVPAPGTDATFDALSPSCTVNALNRNCRNINFTGYTNTLTMTFGIFVSGTVTFISTQSSRIAGTGTLNINANSTITSNGGTWPNALTFTGTITVTLADILTVNGLLTTVTGAVTINTNSISVRGDFILNTNLNGTTTFNIDGTGNQTWNSSGGSLNVNTNINKASGNLTFASGNKSFGGTAGITLTYVSLGTGALITTGSTLVILTSRIQSNGINWGNINAASNIPGVVITLLDDMSINNVFSSGSFSCTLNGFNVNINGDINITSNGLTGTSILNIVGAGNQTWNGGSIINNLKINKSSGTFTLNGTCTYGFGIGTNNLLEHISGPVVTTGSTLNINGNCQIKSNVGNPNAIVFNNLTFANQVYTLTLIDNMTINSFIPSGGGQGAGSINGNTLFIRGDITIGALGVNQFFGGTAIFNISGTGAQTWSSSSTSTLRNNIVINKASGTLNLSGTIRWGLSGNTLTYSQGLINAGTSTFISVSGSIFNLTTTGFSLYNWNPAVGTVAINTQPLVVNSNLTISGGTAFTGTAGWTCVNLICPTAGGFNITLQQAITYTTTAAVSITGGVAAPGSRPTMTSSGASNAIWRLVEGATQSLIYVNGTRIDSSGGQTVWSFGVAPADISTTINWNSGTRPGTVAYSFIF